MRSFFTARNVTIALSAAFVAGLALGGAAYAVTGGTFRYTTPKTGYLMIPAAAFVPTSHTIMYVSDAAQLEANGGGCFAAPVNLPHGAKITHLAVWYSKTDANSTDVELRRLSLAPLDGRTIATVTLAGTAGQFKSAGVNVTADQIVNNARFTYSLYNCLSAQEIFFGARIKYTYTTAGD